MFYRGKSFSDFKNRILRRSSIIRNLYTGKRILIDEPDAEIFLELTFAVLNSGNTPCLWNWYFNDTQKQHALAQNSYAAVISTNDSWGTLKRLPAESLNGERLDSFHLNPTQNIIFYTSGTIAPKACVLSLESLLINALGANSAILFQPGDIWGLCLPHFHVGGFSIFIRALLNGAQVEDADLKTTSSITHLSLVPTQLQRMEKNPYPKLRYCMIGGSSILQDLVSQKYRDFPLYLSYGMTEMGSVVAITDKITDPCDFRMKPLPYRDVQIRDGLISVGGDCLFEGYLQDDQIQKAEKIFLTSDLGELSGGNLIVKGRKDRIFQSGGENISCDFIEKEISKLMGVKNIRIEAEQDSEYGMIPVAYIHLENRTVEDLQKELIALLPGLMRPRKYYPFQVKTWKGR